MEKGRGCCCGCCCVVEVDCDLFSCAGDIGLGWMREGVGPSVRTLLLRSSSTTEFSVAGGVSVSGFLLLVGSRGSS